jgi:transcriptional regulator with GAF, ATPase, and Fis domain
MPRRSNVPPAETVRAALEAANGIQDRAARALGVPRTTLQKWLAGPLSDLRSYVDEIRARYAPDGRGRPWITDGARSREEVARAWEQSGYRLSVAARLLELPRTSLRHLLHRYGMPNLPAPGRHPRK